RSKSAAELMAPADTTTIPAEYCSVAPARSTRTVVTSRPEAFVSRRVTRALVRSVTFAYSRAGLTQTTSAWDLALTRQGGPAHVAQRMHGLFHRSPSASMLPSGT